MRKTSSLLCLLFLLLVLAAPAHANLFGKYLQGCPAVLAQDDPLTAPDDPGHADHNHTASGSTAFSASMTTAAMYAAPTTCFLRENHSAYWAPTMDKDGISYPASFSSYYAANGANPAGIAGGRIQPFPTGFRAIFGNSKSTVLQSTSLVRWRCSGLTPTYSSPPTNCPGTYGIAMEIDTPNICWNGEDLDSPDHKSHFVNNIAGGSCPAAFSIRLPQLQAAFSYPRAAMGGMLSSDHGVGPAGRSAHFDLWEAQDPDQQDQLTRCLNDPNRSVPTSPTCGTFTYDGAPGTSPGPNPWQVKLIAWAYTIGYVNSAGNASVSPPVTP